MKKKVISTVFLLVLLFSLTLGTISITTVEASTTHHVHPGESIQEAINSAQPGDMIFVYAGTYYEHVVVNNAVSLIGENRSTTIIDGNGTGTVISIQASGVNISEFTIQNGHCGIFCNSKCNAIKNNLVSNNFEAANLYSNGTSIIGNLIKDNMRGLMLGHSSGNTIIGNAISNCGNATFLWDSTDNVISSNVLSNSFVWGMPISSSHNNIITNNTLLSNEYGIYLEFSHNNTVSENNIVGNLQYGIFLWSAFDNSIHHNNLFNNTGQVYDVAWTNPEIGNSVNSWNTSYGSSGNYWSDYIGVDEKSGPNQDQPGSDGIGDTAYEIDANNQDNYPLMGTFSNFNATSEYCVQTICNSSISSFQFNGTAIRFNVTGEDGTTGFCRMLIPTALMNEPYRVLVNGTEVSYDLLPFSNETHSYLYFVYTHSTQEVVIIPEFPSFLILPVFMIATLLAVIVSEENILCDIRLSLR